jgi:hypothetical protein
MSAGPIYAALIRQQTAPVQSHDRNATAPLVSKPRSVNGNNEAGFAMKIIFGNQVL